MTTRKLKSIQDIAQLAGVSKSTVSRALNNSSLVRQETRDAIQTIAREHEFRPSATARSLSLRASRTIGFVNDAYNKGACNVSCPFSLEIMGGITVGLHELGYDLLVIHVSPNDRDWVGQYLDTGRVDGFILMTESKKMKHIELLASRGAPFVAWGTSSGRYCTVCGDDRAGGRLACERLLSLGRKRIAFLGGPRAEGEVQARFLGYKEALSAGGKSFDPGLVVYGDYSEESAEHAIKDLLARKPDFDALFSNSDVMAIAALKVLKAHGRRVPKDVAVVGYDDLSLASYVSPALTTISQRIPLAGTLLARDLVTFLEQGIVTHTVVPVELVVRESA
ncbi:MAG TPA: LacI family DNA-binding transcriptional regulator [Spirochaetia bacterium]|nr:LacI family DNA-binding transcriptional regulator [Spirochaetia bacterium]